MESKFYITPLGYKTRVLLKHSETDKAICFTETRNICVYHPPGMIGSPYAKYADKKYYYWIPKSVVKKSIESGITNLEKKVTSWFISLPKWYDFKVSREHFLKKKIK